MPSESEKCGCKASKPTTSSDCPGKSNNDNNTCCGSSSEKTEKPKCGRTSACSQKEEQCSKKSDSGKSKRQCSKESNKEDCHSSHEQFKKGKDQCLSSGKGKCNESYKSFLKHREDTSLCPREEVKCDDTRNAFFSIKDPEKSPSSLGAPNQQDKCHPCSSSMEPPPENPCSSAHEKATVHKQNLCSTLKALPPHKPCGSEEQRELSYRCSKTTEKTSDSKAENLGNESTFSKISGYCKNLANQYVTHNPKNKCSGGDKNTTNQISQKETLELPPRKHPSPPMTEVGLFSRVKVDCTSKATCPQIKKPDLSAFFPLDVRNKELNDCIEKWSKKDPNQVISMCSRFATKTGSTLCQEVTRKTEAPKKWMGKRFSLMVPAKHRQLAARWTPSAAGYLATSALLIVYVTEWKTILRHVPFYNHVQEETAPT